MRALFRNCLLVLLGTVIGAALDSGAQVYVGAASGISSTSPKSKGCPNCTTYDADYVHPVAKLYAGYRLGQWAIEGGGGQLSKSTGSGSIATRPSDMYGSLKTKYRYLQLLRHVQMTDRLEGFGGVGMAWYRMTLNERGINCTPEADGTYITYDNDTRCNRSGYSEITVTEEKGRRPMFTLGAEYKIAEHIKARLSWERVTGMGGNTRFVYKQRADAVWFALQASF